MENCPICGGPCQVFSAAGKGDRFNCPRCGKFVFKDDFTTGHVMTFVQSKKDAQKALCEYIKNNQVKDGDLEFDWKKIIAILKEAGVEMGGYRIR